MAAVRCCLSITSCATPTQPTSRDSSNTSPAEQSFASRPPTKVLLPNGKPLKWSTGVAPGEYGGPPTSSKLRKYWGGDEDPLASDDYLWNKEFMGRMKKLIQDSDDDDSDPSLQSAKEVPSGFLSLNRVMSLDNLELDLSRELAATSDATFDLKIEEQLVLGFLLAYARGKEIDFVLLVKGFDPWLGKFSDYIYFTFGVVGTVGRRWKAAPTRREQEKWDRATKATTGGSDVMVRESRRPRGDPEVLASMSKEQYYKLKNKLQLLTIGLGGVGLISTYVSYSPEISASYGVGLLGSLAYMRMLGNSVDSLADGAKGLVKGAIGQQRVLVPVILVMLYNRWNEILVPDYGVMPLHLIPMLVGFFTYKIATFMLAIEEAINGATGKTQA